MCTLIVLHRCFPGVRLVVAANRDEYVDRPAEGPTLRSTGGRSIVAPRDVRGGGTWLGVSSEGLFAAITNRPCDVPDRDRRSRGLLVLDALEAPTADAAADALMQLGPNAYNPFNLFMADRERAVVVTYEGSPRRIDLEPGAHVIGNADPELPTPKLARIREYASHVARGATERAPESLAVICRDHEGKGDTFQDACVHAGGYGTRSSTLLVLGDPDSESGFWHAGDAPCRAEYEDFTPLLHDLQKSSRPVRGIASTRKVL